MAEKTIRLKRTGLYASGATPVNMIQAIFYNEDMLIYDLEDSVPASEKDTWAQPIPAGTIPEGIRLIAPAGAASCRAASEPYNENTSFRLTVDGFMVSDNVSVAMSEVIDTVFAHSDHNPVEMIFTLN